MTCPNCRAELHEAGHMIPNSTGKPEWVAESPRLLCCQNCPYGKNRFTLKRGTQIAWQDGQPVSFEISGHVLVPMEVAP